MHCHVYLQTAYGYTSLQCTLLLKVYIIYIRTWLPRETWVQRFGIVSHCLQSVTSLHVKYKVPQPQLSRFVGSGRR